MTDAQQDTAKDPGYETTDAKIKPVLISAFGLFGLMLVAILLMIELFFFFRAKSDTRKVESSPLAVERQLPPLPRLQVRPELDWKVFEAKQDSVLNSYAWVVREAGVVRIPIETAMELALERGFPTRNENADSTPPGGGRQ